MKNNGRRMHILAAGRLAGQKNFPRLLRAFAAARAANPTVGLTLAIAGEGKDKAALVSFADELGVAQHVQWLGHTDNMPELMGQADLFALSSDYEGLPAVVIEALACDCPVIATDCFPAARELLSGLSGCMVTECTDIAFADGLAAAVRAVSAESGDRPSLREHALDYSTRSSVLSHLAAMNLMPSDAKCDA
jgi:glycosyltransferase involved in cell wall biosynthesis